jgi:sugar phosphate isomerase/epimerase
MAHRRVDIGVVTDEVSRNLGEALDLAEGWGMTRFELREGSRARFPAFTKDEIALLDEHVRGGSRVTAVSPGIFKGHADDREKLDHELGHVLPRSLELANRFGCPLLIVFGFERYDGEPVTGRRAAMDAFERAANLAVEAGMTVVIENEPNFWVDRPVDTAELLSEIGHPGLMANWDPANSHWGGFLPTYEEFQVLKRHIGNVHVKDYYPADPAAPWRPIGQGETPWSEMLRWVVAETDLTHVTLETHCVPLVESSKVSLDNLRAMLDSIGEVSA